MTPDLVTLSWCLGEIREALAQTERLLGQQLQADSEDLSSVRAARAALHQAHGALEVVAVDGVSLITQEAETLLDAVERGQRTLNADLVSRMSRAFDAVLEHLEELMQDVPHQPLRLYPYYKALLEARGAERVHPADLFFPDLAVHLPEPAQGYRQAPTSELAGARAAFERGLLRLMREPASADGPRAMAAAVEDVCGSQLGSVNRAFWWVTQAYFDALGGGRLPVDVNVKRLLARFNLQLRKAVEDRAPVAERLVKDMLFALAGAPGASPRVDAVREAFRLDGAIPADLETPRYGQLDARALRAARDALGKARVAFDKVARGALGEVAAFTQAIDAFRDAVDKLPGEGLLALGRAFTAVRRGVHERDGRLDDATSIELATAILFAEQALEKGARPGSEYDQHGAEMGERLVAALEGRADPDAEPPEWLRSLSQAAQERMTMAAFIGETMTSLRGVEKVLDAFFRDHAQRANLPECVRALHQVAGALRLLGHEDACTGAESVATRVAAFAASEESPDPAECDRVASSAGALGFFIEGLLYPERASGRFELDPETGEFHAHMGRSPRVTVREIDDAQAAGPARESVAPAPSVESAFAEHAARAARQFSDLERHGDDPGLRDRLHDTLVHLRDAAMLLDDAARKSAAADAIGRLAAVGTPLDLARLRASLASAGVAIAAAPAVAPALPVDDDAQDSELMEIFLSEADDVLGAIAEHAELSRQSRGDAQHLTTIRRGFHTLKGSSRMVGLTDFGEAGWAMEQVMNLWLAEERSGTDPLYRLIDQACAEMRVWVDALRAGGAVEIDPRALVEAANALREGRSPDDAHLLALDDASAEDEFAETVFAAPEPPAETVPETLVCDEFAAEQSLAQDAADDGREDVIEIGAPSAAFDEADAPVDAVAHEAVVDVVDASDAGEVIDVAVAVDADEAVDAGEAVDIGEAIDIGEAVDVGEAIDIGEAVDVGEAVDFAEAVDDENAVEFDDAIEFGDALASADESAVEIVVGEVKSEDDGVVFDDDDESGAGRTDEIEFDEIPASLAAPLDQEEIRALKAMHDARHAMPESPEAPVQAPAEVVPSQPGATISADTIVLDGLEISRPLYMIFLSEADELIETLVEDTADWRERPGRGATDAAMRAAHSLSGSSSVVELDPVHGLAERLESFMLSQRAVGDAPSGAELQLVARIVERIRSMLHVFAAGHLPPHEPDALEAIAALAAYWHEKAQALAAKAPADIGEFVDADDAVAAAQAMDLAGDDDAQPGLEPATWDEAPVTALADDDAFVPELTDPVTAAAPVLAPAPVDEIDPDLLPIFVEEALDYLPQIGENLRRWQASPSDTDALQMLMRQLHTVKGSARMAGAMSLGQRVHEIETRVEDLAGLPGVPAEMIEGLIGEHDQVVAMFDAIRGVSAPVAAAEPAAPAPAPFEPEAIAPTWMPSLPALIDEIVERSVPAGESVPGAHESVPATSSGQDTAADPALAHFADTVPAPEAFATPATAPASPPARAGALAGLFANTPAPTSAPAAAPGTRPAGASQPLVRVRADLLDKLVNEAGEVSIARSRLDNEMTSLRQALADLTENVGRLRSQLREIEIQADTQIQARIAQQRETERAFDPLEFDRYTRFQELTRMLAESVNDVATVQQNAMRGLEDASQDLHRQGQVLRDLQQNLMRVRMVQFGSIADRLFRVVRQSGKELDKQVHLDIRGSAVEVDRGVLEKMSGPIEHLLRNAVAHGVEPADVRTASGKSPTGEITVEVRQEGREIVLSFADDGAGLDYGKIRARAIATGLIKPDAGVPDRELGDLIFMPGFTTAATVTELSGRGVGMDVVRGEVVGLGGRIETESESGRGTRFTVHLPLTLAVSQVVLVTAGRTRLAVPSSSVEQVLQVKPQALAAAYTDRFIEWQGAKVPLFYLGTLVELPDLKPVAQHYSPVVILRSGHQRIALHCDDVTRNQEVVVKPVGPQVARVRGVTGATVLGNGEIVLIVNPVALAQIAAGEVLDRVVAAPAIAAVLQDTLPAIAMVVDDSLTVRKVTQRLLAREGYQVLLAKDGVDAMRQLQETVPDVMLVDIEMPRMDGFDLTRNVRGDERFKHVPIIMITSRTADKHRNYAMSLGVDAYLGKPYAEDELLALVASYTSQRHVAAAV